MCFTSISYVIQIPVVYYKLHMQYHMDTIKYHMCCQDNFTFSAWLKCLILYTYLFCVGMVVSQIDFIIKFRYQSKLKSLYWNLIKSNMETWLQFSSLDFSAMQHLTLVQLSIPIHLLSGSFFLSLTVTFLKWQKKSLKQHICHFFSF